MSIRVRPLLLILFATLIPAVVGGWQFLERRDAEVAAAQRDLAAAAQRVARVLRDTVRGTLGGARAWDPTSHRLVKNFLQTEHCPSYLTRLKSCLEKDAGHGTQTAC